MKNINVKIEGKGDPIVLVNGLIHDLTTWNYYATILSKKFTVIRFDFPNQGESYDDADYKLIGQQANTILDVIESANYKTEDVIIIAQSSGASITRHLHCNMGAQFKKIFLLGINPGGLHNFYTQLYSGYKDLLHSSGVNAYYRSIAPMLFSPLFFEDNPDALEEIITSCENTYQNREIALSTLVDTPFHDHTLENPPTNFTSATIMIHGHLDYLVPGEKREEYYKKCESDMVTTKVMNGGHCFAFEEPIELVKEIMAIA